MKVMAKDYIRTKNYITKFIEMKTHLNAVSLKMQVSICCMPKLFRINGPSMIDSQEPSSDG